MHYRLHLLLAGLFIIIATAPATIFAALPASPSPHYTAGEVLIKLKPGFSLSDQARTITSLPSQEAWSTIQNMNTLLSRLQAYQSEVLYPGSDTYRVVFNTHSDAAELATTLASHPAVAFAQPNYIRHIMRTPNDTNIREQWALTNIQAYEAWDITTGNGILVAVLDTGVMRSHPDLDGKVQPGFNAVADTDQTEDDNGHGTAVAGLIAAKTNNGKGIAGMCWGCSILPIKVLTARGSGSDFGVARGIHYAADAGARVINLSLGGTESSDVLREAVEYAHSRGALIVAASGNERQNGNGVNYPAAYPQVLAVGGTGNTDAVTGFSNTGDYVGIAAPSVGLWTTTIDGEYGPPNGTSFSTPYVAGVAGLVFTLRPDLSNDDIKCILEASADDKGAPGKDPEYGWGRLNAFKAVQLAQTYAGCPLNRPEQPAPTPPQPSNPSGPFSPVAPVPNTFDQTYFPETQHTLQGEFKRYWEQYGGLSIFGYPISEGFMERGTDGIDYIVQYFERHRFELHLESPEPYNVQLARLGDLILESQGRSWFTFPKGTPGPGCLFFEATGHTLCEPFLSSWRSSGLEFDGQFGKSFEESLALFGQPISEPQVEEIAPGVTVTVQWFERARFEDHGSGQVLLGLLSSELARARGWR